MPTALRNTDILFNDGTTQSTAGQPTSTSLVLSATAGASAGGVGTYGFLSQTADTTNANNITAGSTYAGSGLAAWGLVFNNFNGSLGTPDSLGATQSGTWMAMGSVIRNTNTKRFTLFLRIA
jgi:hypothetical protein